MPRGKFSIASLCAVPFACLSGVQAAEHNDSGYVLEVQPSICISYDSDEPCTMALQVSWRGPAAAEVCLRQLLLDPMLQCWHDSTGGSAELTFISAEDVQYHLQLDADADPLASADVKVINRDLRNSRKRRRHVWSIL